MCLDKIFKGTPRIPWTLDELVKIGVKMFNCRWNHLLSFMYGFIDCSNDERHKKRKEIYQHMVEPHSLDKGMMSTMIN